MHHRLLKGLEIVLVATLAELRIADLDEGERVLGGLLCVLRNTRDYSDAQ